MGLVTFKSNFPLSGVTIEPGTPLWQIVPTRDEDGRPLADFMILIPGLRSQPQYVLNTTLNNIQKVLEQCREVVFVNLNLKINVLWVSVNCRQGIIMELVTSIQRQVPEAVLVAQKAD
jgi:hypothetical protein